MVVQPVRPKDFHLKPEQHHVLRNTFMFIPNPDNLPDTLNMLSRDTGLEEKFVKLWFKNMRKRLNIDQDDDAADNEYLEDDVDQSVKESGMCPVDYNPPPPSDNVLDDTDDSVNDSSANETKEEKSETRPLSNICDNKENEETEPIADEPVSKTWVTEEISDGSDDEEMLNESDTEFEDTLNESEMLSDSDTEEMLNRSANEEMLNRSANEEKMKWSANEEMLKTGDTEKILNTEENEEMLNTCDNKEMLNCSANEEISNTEDNEEMFNKRNEELLDTNEMWNNSAHEEMLNTGDTKEMLNSCKNQETFHSGDIKDISSGHNTQKVSDEAKNEETLLVMPDKNDEMSKMSISKEDMDELSIAIGSILPSANEEEEIKEFSNAIENIPAEENFEQVEECIPEEAENSVMEVEQSVLDESTVELVEEIVRTI